MNDFLKAIGNKKVIGYKAIMQLKDGRIGITPVYTLPILQIVINDAKRLGHKLIKIKNA